MTRILTVLAIAGSVMSYTRGQAGSACRISQTQEDGTFTFDVIRRHSTTFDIVRRLGDDRRLFILRDRRGSLIERYREDVSGGAHHPLV